MGAPKELTRRRAEKRLSKRCFWRVRFFSAPLKLSGVLRANLKGAEKKRTLQNHPYGQLFLCTTPSLLLWHALKLDKAAVASLFWEMIRKATGEDFLKKASCFEGSKAQPPHLISKKGALTSVSQSERVENGELDPSWLDFAFWGRPDFQSRGPKMLISKGLGTSGLKIGAHQKHEIQPRRIQLPTLGPLSILIQGLGSTRLISSTGLCSILDWKV